MTTIIAPEADLLDSKRGVRVATTANITLSGLQTIDTISLVAGDRVLAKNQTIPSENGIYEVSAGAWSRAVDVSDDTQVVDGVYVWVREGTANGNTAWFLETIAPIVLGTTALTFEQFAASGGIAPHAPDHQNSGSDEINVAGLSGELADPQPPKAHAPDHQNGGSDEVATTTPAANAIPKAGAGGELAAGWIPEAGVTQHEAAIDHDALTNFDIAKHRIIDDVSNSTIELLSANKINALVSAIDAGIDIKGAVDTTTTGLGNITLSGEQTLNGLLTSTSRVLVTEQTVPADNGIYVSATGAWARASDADEDIEVTNGNLTHVLNSGSTKFKFKYLLVTPDPITVGTTGQTWEEHKDIDFGTTAGTATEGNDSRVPSQDENNALVGTNGTPSTANKYVTDSDPRNTDARTPTAHAPSHLPSGSDPLTTAVAGAIAVGDTAAVGTAESFARSDHRHSLAAPAAPANVDKSAASAGSSPNTARQDHKHDVATAAPSQGVGGGNSEGTSTSVARADHDHTLRETGGPTELTLAGVPDGQFLKRSGTTIVGDPGGGKVVQTKTVELGTDETTTSVTPTFVTLLTTTITVSAGSDLIVIATISASNDANNNNIVVRLLIDGTASKGAQEEQKSTGISATLSVSSRKSGLTVGSKTVTLQWSTSANTAQCRPVTLPNTEHAVLQIFEVTG